MDYTELRKIEDVLAKKDNLTAEDRKLLKELQSLASIIHKHNDFSLSMPSKVCKACGRPL